jgi:hypothetical protein
MGLPHMAKSDYEPDWEELATLRKEMLDTGGDTQRRRARYLAFVETISHLDRLAKAEAWLGYVASHVENFSDQEALICRVSRGFSSEEEIGELIGRWKGAVENARERYALDPMSFDPERGFFKPEQPKRADDPIRVADITSVLLHNFWRHYDHEAPIIDATMLRTAEWCGIGGFDEWWQRLANDEKESMLKGGLSALRGFRWLFHMCRSNLAISLMGNTLRRGLESLEIPEDSVGTPWKFLVDRTNGELREVRRVDHIPVACTIAFASSRLSVAPSPLVKKALEMIQGYQREDGSWPYWADDARPCPETTAFAVHVLASQKPLGWQRACSRARDWLWSIQTAPGCWEDARIPAHVYLTVLAMDAIDLADGGQRNTVSLPSEAARAIPKGRRFKVALSFPGEIRPTVERVAKGLARKLMQDRVFYDRWYEPELARIDLDVYLQHIYHDQSDLIVVFFCPDYERKEWCGLEWRAIRDIIKQRRGDDIMLVKMGDVQLNGLFSIDGYLDGTKKNGAELARAILTRTKPCDG